MYNKITINENSVITSKEASEILDNIFVCGTKIETKTTCRITGQELDTYYYDCTETEKKEHIKSVFKNTIYENNPDCKNKFELDFLRWVRLGWQIQEFGSKRTGEYLPTNEHWKKSIGIDIERQEIWERIKPVFYKDQLKQQNNIQKIKSETHKPNKQKSNRSIKLTEQQTIIFNKAIEDGLMEKSTNGYTWKHNNRLKASLAYFLEKVFAPKGTEQMPYQNLEIMFNVSRLDSALTQVHNAKKPQKWKTDIDKIFSE